MTEPNSTSETKAETASEQLYAAYGVPPKLRAAFDRWRRDRVAYIKEHIQELERELKRLEMRDG